MDMMEWNALTILGLVAGAVVAASLTMSEPLKLRVLNGMGALLFVVYGYFIGDLPIVAFNVWVLFMDLYYLRKILRERQA